jgi:hypothetical protein
MDWPVRGHVARSGVAQAFHEHRPQQNELVAYEDRGRARSMIEILFTVCTLSSGVCEEHSIPAPNELVCLTQAQGEIVRTYPFRPDQVLTRYGCSRSASVAELAGE